MWQAEDLGSHHPTPGDRMLASMACFHVSFRVPPSLPIRRRSNTLPFCSASQNITGISDSIIFKLLKDCHSNGPRFLELRKKNFFWKYTISLPVSIFLKINYYILYNIPWKFTTNVKSFQFLFLTQWFLQFPMLKFSFKVAFSIILTINFPSWMKWFFLFQMTLCGEGRQ